VLGRLVQSPCTGEDAGHLRASDETREERGLCYPSIAEHGLIGDLQTAALIPTGG